MSSFAGKTILVVDDEEFIREIIADELKHLGATVLEAGNGRDAFALFEKQHIDVVISDVRMPGGDGIELLNRIKASRVEMPVVLFITGHSDMTKDVVYAIGAEAIFGKPFELDQIISVIAFLLKPLPERTAERNSIEPVAKIERFFDDFESALEKGQIQLGRGGLFLLGAEGAPPTGHVTFHFHFKTGTMVLVSGEGIVRWLRKSEKGGQPAGVGLEYTYLPEPIRKALYDLVAPRRVLAFIPSGSKP